MLDPRVKASAGQGTEQDPALSPGCERAARLWSRVFQMPENHPLGCVLVVNSSLFSKVSVGIGALLC